MRRTGRRSDRRKPKPWLILAGRWSEKVPSIATRWPTRRLARREAIRLRRAGRVDWIDVVPPRKTRTDA